MSLQFSRCLRQVCLSRLLCHVGWSCLSTTSFSCIWNTFFSSAFLCLREDSCIPWVMQKLKEEFDTVGQGMWKWFWHFFFPFLGGKKKQHHHGMQNSSLLMFDFVCFWCFYFLGAFVRMLEFSFTGVLLCSCNRQHLDCLIMSVFCFRQVSLSIF